MLKMLCYGSSSKGNCFTIEDDNGMIMLDCGIKNISDIIDIKKLESILISHQHT